MEKQNSNTSRVEVWRFVRATVLFVFLTLVWYLGILFVGTKIPLGQSPLSSNFAEYYSIKGGDTYTRYNTFKPQHKYDVLVFGSSHAYRSYDPRIFKQHGLNMYNLGSSGQSINDTYVVVTEILKVAKPNFIVIDMTPGAFESDGIESSSKLITNIENYTFAKRILLNNPDWRMVNVFVTRNFNSYKPIPFKESADNGTYINGGYVEIKKECIKKYNYHKLGEKFKPTDLNKKGFSKLLTYLKEQHIVTKFVLHPIPHETNSTQNKLFLRFLKKEIEKIPNIQIIDFSFAHALNKTTHFYDHHHLNQAGTTIFNNQLLPLLTK